ncbi:MAG TPA: hypothetical protein PLN80_00170 [Anaerolineaceae bacterium]|nr:hypothetical protein [Anaerolineaceae bacterium]
MLTRRPVLFRLLLSLCCVALLAACAKDSAPALPLTEYTEPAGRYAFAIPEGWQSASTTDTLTLTPKNSEGTSADLAVRVYLAPTNTDDPVQHVDAAKKLIEPFLRQYLDDTYESVNEGETKVDRLPAALLDFAKPWQDTYLVGRVVFVALPGYVIVFLGTGERVAWDAFLPTFREMLKEFHLTSLVTTVTPLVP